MKVEPQLRYLWKDRRSLRILHQNARNQGQCNVKFLQKIQLSAQRHFTSHFTHYTAQLWEWRSHTLPALSQNRLATPTLFMKPTFIEELERVEKERGILLEKLRRKVDKLYENSKTIQKRNKKQHHAGISRTTPSQ